MLLVSFHKDNIEEGALEGHSLFVSQWLLPRAYKARNESCGIRTHVCSG